MPIEVMNHGWYNTNGKVTCNTAANLEARGMSSGFSFLGTSAGFDIAWSIIPYEPQDTFGRVYLVGLTNTLAVSLLAIVLTTILGFIIGVLRLSHNWLISTMAAWYVEIIRNTPLLLQIIFWYTAVFSVLPRPKQSIDIGGKAGDSISAAADGKVVYAGGALKGYGELVIIKHGEDYLTAYGHNAKLLVQEGQQIKAGQAIATMGLGPQNRPLVHFEIRRLGQPVDPEPLLP